MAVSDFSNSLSLFVSESIKMKRYFNFTVAC